MDYPAQWEADVLAADGGILHLRPIRPDDAARIVALHSRLSDRTIYLRYFGAYPRIPERDLRRLVQVDYVDRVALVAELGEEIVGVGRYDRIGSGGDAEVAFVVEDAHQGRGLGSVLLEHLAAAARERGIRRFVAEVLAENSRMVRVFLDAGYSATREYADGVIHLTFPVEPTETSLAVAYERERRAEARSIGRLLTPETIAVVGASADPGKAGHVVFANLAAYGFQGSLYPINPNARHVGSVRAYASVLDVPDEVDLAVVAVPARSVPAVVSECARKGVRGLVVLSGGFAERDAAGRAAERELVAAARAAGIRVVGPNCLGVVNADPAIRLNATFAPYVPGRGRVGFFCQSGALGVAILQTAARRGLGLSTFVSAGNRADVSGNDLLQYWDSDPATDVVLLYLESFGNPRKFARLARRLARRKPVVAVKTGRYAVSPILGGGRSEAVPEESVQAIFEASGMIRVDTLAEMFDMAQLLAYQPLPRGRRVAAVTNSAALGVLVVDACLAAGLTVASGGPLDIGADASAAEFAAALISTVDGDVDAVVAVFAPPLSTPGTEYARVLAETASGPAAATGIPVVSTFLGVEGMPALLRTPGPDGAAAAGSVPSYPTPEQAVQALARAVTYAEWRRRPAGILPEFTDLNPDAAQAVVDAALAGASAGRDLSSAEASRLLRMYGVPVEPSIPARSVEDAIGAADTLGYPVAMKSTVLALQHRPDLGAVRLDLADADGVRAAWVALTALAADTPGADTTAAAERAGADTAAEPDPDPALAVVQRMAPPGVATVVELIDDPSFGALVSFAVAGLATDLLGDRAYAAVPLTDVGAA
ncbi:MAG TPA: GNAT family N-acetyltransferase, partial [Mycobacteriales bacterium]